VIIKSETDFPETRFAPGASVWTLGREAALTVSTFRIQGGRPVVGFEGLSRIEDVESLAGAELRVPEAALASLPAGTYYEYQLVGCAVETIAGERVGTVVKVEGGGPRLVVDGPRGEVLVPLAVEICVDIDVEAKRIRIAPPSGLLEVNQGKAQGDRPTRR
jgi:16S rRNA processing protein RimM